MRPEPGERPAGPRFDLRAQRGEARLHARRPLPLTLGALRELELVAGEIGSTLDLRAGALAFRDRRTHAVGALLSLDVAAVEQMLRGAGVELTLHPSAGGQGAQVFGATLMVDGSPVDCEVRGVLEDGDIALRVRRVVSTLPREGLAELVRDGLRPLERRAAEQALTMRVSLEPGRGDIRHDLDTGLRVVVEDALEALLRSSFLAAGWRLPRTRGLRGHLIWCEPSGRQGASLSLSASLTGSTTGGPTAEGAARDPQRAELRAVDAPREALGHLLARAPHAALDVLQAQQRMDAYVGLEPSPIMRADALLVLAEVLCGAELAQPLTAPERDALVAQLGLRALAAAGRSPDVARRVLSLARRAASPVRDERLLAAVLAAPLPAVQQAALVLDAIPALVAASPARARAWLERVRPFAAELSRLHAAEAALLEAEQVPEAKPESAAQAHERTAEALASEGRSDDASRAYALAARAYQQARDVQAAARCWVLCVSAASSDALALDWVVPGASALQLAGRTQDALALLATLLSREVGAAQREAYTLALESAVRFHEALPPALAAPELFAARRSDALESIKRST